MKKLAILLLVLIPIALLSIEFTDYTNPVSFGQEAYLNGNFNFKSGNQDQANYNGLFNGNYLIYYNSLPFNWKVGTDGKIEFSRGPNTADDAETGYSATAFANADRYFNDTEFFGYGSLNLGYRKNMAMNDADDPYAKIGVGLGYGRVIDATVLAKSMRIIDELMKFNVINGELSTGGYIELAQIIEKVGEYETKYGGVEYKKYWYEDMEKVLAKEGLLPEGNLKALGLVRLQEVLDQRFSSRKYGWTLRGGIGYVLSNYDGSDSDPSLDVSFEYANPISKKLQFIERMDYSTILADELDHMIVNKASLTYELSTLVDWENALITTITVPGASNAENLIDNNFKSTFYYYVTNKINLNTSLTLHLYGDGVDNNGNDDLDTTFFFGMAYRLR
ncbi:MAG: hypothetical protein CVU48_06285 [Candidatus Cloacimonetes bacterium HGW-Cloacimonetes-1]|jgi:hypothetical protein|nr:MAG: hypothetical protein CVU48_06285 [Candidatus Cloacimonetes bacterium HGW-Cloacimonetes-1]